MQVCECYSLYGTTTNFSFFSYCFVYLVIYDEAMMRYYATADTNDGVAVINAIRYAVVSNSQQGLRRLVNTVN